MGRISSDSPSITDDPVYLPVLTSWMHWPWFTLQPPGQSSPSLLLPTGALRLSGLTAPSLSVRDALLPITTEKSKQNKGE